MIVQKLSDGSYRVKDARWNKELTGKPIIKERAVITLTLKNKKTGKTAKQVINIVQSPKETGKIDRGRIDKSAKIWVKQEAPRMFRDPMELVSYSIKKMPHKYYNTGR